MRNQESTGLPWRPWRPRRRDALRKLDLKDTGMAASVVPMRVRVEVHGGRSTTAATMRAYRILQQIEETGGVASIIQVAPDGSALVAEVDAAQAQGLARIPFVRRIVTMN